MHQPTDSNSRRSPQDADLVAVVDSWYAEAIGEGRNKSLNLGSGTPGIRSVDAQIAQRYPRGAVAARRSGVVRGLFWFMATVRAERMVCPLYSRGLAVFLLLEWLLGGDRRRVYLLEFIRPEPVGWIGRIKELVHVAFFRLVFPRTLAAAQVMTVWEGGAYADKYRLPQTVFQFIPFPVMLSPSEAPPVCDKAGAKVLSSGRAACDWATLFAAARGAQWKLTVVCSKEDKAAVERLNTDGNATVLCEVSEIQHERLLLDADVYALVLREQNASSGQVRLARAIEAGIPVVASNVRGLDGYLEHGVTGIAVPPLDASALRAAIDELVNDAEQRNRLRVTAYEAMRPRTLASFIQHIKAFCLRDQAHVPAA